MSQSETNPALTTKELKFLTAVKNRYLPEHAKGVAWSMIVSGIVITTVGFVMQIRWFPIHTEGLTLVGILTAMQGYLALKSMRYEELIVRLAGQLPLVAMPAASAGGVPA